MFVGVLGGIPAFGPIGIIAGPVALSLALALIEFAEETRQPVPGEAKPVEPAPIAPTPVEPAVVPRE